MSYSSTAGSGVLPFLALSALVPSFLREKNLEKEKDFYKILKFLLNIFQTYIGKVSDLKVSMQIK